MMEREAFKQRDHGIGQTPWQSELLGSLIEMAYFFGGIFLMERIIGKWLY